MKVNNNVKRIIAILLLIIVLINSLPIKAFADYITDMNKNAFFGVIENSFNYYKHEMHYCIYDGAEYMLFCSESNKPSVVNKEYAYGSEFWVEYKANRQDYSKIAEMIYFGYVMNYGTGIARSLEAQKAAACTQQYVWEYIHNNIDGSKSVPTRDSWNPNLMSSSIYANWLSQTEGYYNQYHNTNVSFAGSTNTVKAGESTTLNDTNNVLSSYDDFNTTVSGVTFSHTRGSNDLTISASDDSVGTANFSSSNNNIFKLLPNGTTYDRNTMSTFLYFQFNSGVIQNLMFSNYIDPSFFNVIVNVEENKGDLKVKKVNSLGNPVANCKFEVYSNPECTNKISSGTSDANGEILFTKLKANTTYYVKEIEVPKGYLIDNSIKSVEIIAKQVATVEFKNNEPTGEIYVYKVNNNGDKIGGAKFKIVADEDIYNVARTQKYYSKGDEVDTIITENETGLAKKSNLPLGHYSVYEIEVPDGYLLNETVYQANLEYQNDVTPIVKIEVEDVIDDEPTGKLTIVKTDKDTGNENRVDGTSHHGDAQIKGAIYTLYAKEDIYNVAKTLKYFSKGDEIATFTFDEYGVASIEIVSTNTKAELSINGIELKGLPMGNYYAKETTVPVGYTQDTKMYDYTFSYKDDKTKEIDINGVVTNVVDKAPFEVIKVTTNDNTTAKTVADAEFTAILTKYVDYYGSFDEALKHLDEFAEDEYDIFRTNKKGHGVSKRLAYGEYTVNETYTPSPEIETVEEFYVTIDKDSVTPLKEFVENDLPFEAYLKLEKKDKKTGKLVTYSNATFCLYKLNETNNQWEKVQCKIKDEYFESWTTNKKGVAKTETKLEAGKYKLTEIKVPKGFVELDEDVIFEVNNRNRTLDYDKDYDAWITVIAENEQPTGTLIVDKSVVAREDVDTSFVDTSDLSGIKFNLTAKENILDMADGSKIYEKGQKIGTYNLDKEGNLKIEKLPMGKYELQEIETLPGLVLDTTKYEIEFKPKDTTTKVYTQTKEIKNNTTLVEFSKTDVTGQKELVGAKLTITDKNGEVIDSWISTEKTHKIEGLKVGNEYTLTEEIAPDEFVKATSIKFTVKNTLDIQKVVMIDKQVTMSKENIGGNEVEGAELKVVDKDENIVDSWTSTKESHNIKGLVEGETYKLYEDYAPDGFVISNSIEFTVTEDKKTQEIKMIDKQVEISKTDIAGEELEGATLVVTNTKTKNIVDKWVSTKEPHKVSGLIEGQTYILHEEVVIDGYVKASDVEFTVTSNKKTQKIKMIDKLVSVKKTDFVTGDEIEGAELIVTDKDGSVVDSWISTKESHNIKGLVEGETYTLTEKTCPYGYEQAESIEFTVSKDKETQLIEMKDMPIFTDVRLVKVDSRTKDVIKDNFKFGIYADEECTKLIKEVESDKDNGTVTFDDLRYGTYYIKELKAPTGYKLSEQVVKIEINDKGVFADEVSLEEKDGIYSFEYVNNLLPKIQIQTGNETNYILLYSLLVISLIGVIGGIIFLLRKKHDKN